MGTSMNVLSEEGKEKFVNSFFTEKGYLTLLQYTKNLVKEYIKRKDVDYGFSLGIVFGIPMFGWGSEIENKQELYGRIKAYMQILGIQDLKIEKENGSILIFELRNKEEKNDVT